MATKATGSKKNMVDETTPKKGSKSVTSKKKTNILKNKIKKNKKNKYMFQSIYLFIIRLIYIFIILLNNNSY